MNDRIKYSSRSTLGILLLGFAFADPIVISIENQSVIEEGTLDLQVLAQNPLDDPIIFQADSDEDWVTIQVLLFKMIVPPPFIYFFKQWAVKYHYYRK